MKIDTLATCNPTVAQVYTRQEAARLLSVSPNTVGKLVRAGRLKAVKTGFGNERQHIRITAEAITDFLNRK